MARAVEIASSLPGQVAQNIVGSVTSALTATGTNLATSLTLPSAVNQITTTAASTGVSLQAGELPGTDVWVYNGGANALLVYTPTGETVNAAAASLSVAAGKGAIFKKISNTAWMGVLTA